MKKSFIAGLLLLLGVATISYTNTEKKTNALTKAFQHQSALGDKVVCYFTQNPICNKLPEKPGGPKDDMIALATFFFPMTNLSNAEARQMVARINGTRRPFYTVYMEEVAKPIKGIKVNFSYNPHEVIFDYERFDAINTHKGLAFSIHYKSELEKLKRKSEPILKFAQSPKVILDFGHGGKDSGKVGCYNTSEKDINFQVGMRLADLLKKKGYQVLLTRSEDSFVDLDQRTSFANREQGDIFLSLHSNAAGRKSVSGIETYCMNHRLLKNVEHQVGGLVTHHKTQKDLLSQMLAKSIHEHVLKAVNAKYALVDRQVRQAVSQVLLGTVMPSALVEMGFLSNPEETKRLASAEYQILIAQGIADGISGFLETISN